MTLSTVPVWTKEVRPHTTTRNLSKHVWRAEKGMDIFIDG